MHVIEFVLSGEVPSVCGDGEAENGKCTSPSWFVVIGTLGNGVLVASFCWYLYVIKGGDVWVEGVAICINWMAILVLGKD